ncbi:MAG: apoptosis-inducing factor 2 [Gaiellales bacterium]|jgi:NADH dehydrogenase FAD-containing subunit|nr:apoptosis-inducing factor 2 [Gaiellales bacterium]
MSEQTGTPTRKTAVVVGGGYGGFSTARALDELVDVTLVEQRDAFVHNVAALRAVVEPGVLPDVFLPYDHLLHHGRVVHDRAVQVDAGRVVLASGTELNPDYLVLATGSRYPYPAKTESHDRASAMERYRETHEQMLRAQRVLILGAGPVGIELAGEISSAWPDKSITITDPQPDIIAGPFKQELREELRRQLEARGIELVLGTGLEAEPATEPGLMEPFDVRTNDGRRLEADIWFRCYGVTPVSDYLTGELAKARRPDGFIEVNPQLQVAGQKRVFALGDVSTIDAKMAGRASQQAAIVAANIQAMIEQTPLQTYEPMPPVIVIPLGPDGGAAQLPGQDEVGGAEVASAIKGGDLLVHRYRELFGLEPAATTL